MQCPKCGNQISSDSAFCPICGNKAESGNSYSFGENLCPKCGAAVANGTKFCAVCGYEIGGETPEIKTVKEEVKAPYIEEKEVKKKNTGLIVFIIILSVIFFLCGLALTYIFLSDAEGFSLPWNKEKPIYKEAEEIAVEEEYEDKVDIYEDADEYEKREEKSEEKAEESGYSSDYLFPSDTRYITERDLINLSQYDVAMIRNEIYARHGYIFRREPYKSYFEAKSWYVQNPNFSEALFNPIEKYNKDFIVEYENRMGWRN